MNIKDFLISQNIDYTLYKLSITEIYDVIVFDKQVTQSVRTELMQYKEKYADWLDENKKEFSKSHRFLKNDLPIWKHTIKWIEPDSLHFDDCKTCDWHWTTICTTCSWKWEVVCPKCNWKTIISQNVVRQKPISWQCTSCMWKWSFSFPCKTCWWIWTIKYYEWCSSCYWRWQILNPQTNQWTYCQQCRWVWKIEKIMPCNTCYWKWQIIQSCTKCWWSWILSWYETYTEKVDTPCSYCSSTWRIKCPTCNGNQELICPTCHWERKTYQCYMNTFDVEVKNRYTLLLNRNLNQSAIDIIWLEPKNTVTKIDENEKQLLLSYWRSENIKVEKESIWRVNWKLYKLESNESWEYYYLWYSTTRDQYYFLNLPPKSNFEELLVSFYRPIIRLFWKLYTWFSKIMKYLKNKKDY